MGPAARLEKMVRKKRGEMKLRRRRRRRRRRFCSALGRFVVLSWLGPLIHICSAIKRELGSGDYRTSSVASVPSLICCFMPLHGRRCVPAVVCSCRRLRRRLSLVHAAVVAVAVAAAAIVAVVARDSPAPSPPPRSSHRRCCAARGCRQRTVTAVRVWARARALRKHTCSARASAAWSPPACRRRGWCARAPVRTRARGREGACSEHAHSAGARGRRRCVTHGRASALTRALRQACHAGACSASRGPLAPCMVARAWRCAAHERASSLSVIFPVSIPPLAFTVITVPRIAPHLLSWRGGGGPWYIV